MNYLLKVKIQNLRHLFILLFTSFRVVILICFDKPTNCIKTLYNLQDTQLLYHYIFALVARLQRFGR